MYIYMYIYICDGGVNIRTKKEIFLGSYFFYELHCKCIYIMCSSLCNAAHDIEIYLIHFLMYV